MGQASQNQTLRYWLIGQTYRFIYRLPRSDADWYRSLTYRMGQRFRERLTPEHATRSRKFISEKHGFCYISNPKVANSTIQRTLTQRVATKGEGRIVAMSSAEYKAFRCAEPLYTFSFVRNPWARALSCYRDKIERGNVLSDIVFAGWDGLTPGLTFEGFVRWLCCPEGSDDHADPHWVSQHKLLYFQDEPLCDFVGKLERLDTDWDAIRTRLGLGSWGFPVRNTTTGPGGAMSYRGAYTDETADLVAQRYSRDIELFDYEF